MLRFTRIILLFVFSSLLIAGSVCFAQEQVVKEPAGYRMNEYRGPVPLTVKGAMVIETAAELQSFLQNNDDVVLLDVYPAARKPDNFPSTDLWIEPKRQTLPDAIWLANTGMGVLTVDLEELFQQQLKALTHNNKKASLVIFCEPECWHSWNAAKRAVSYGYDNIYWYRQGVAGWRKAGLPLQEKTPVRP